MKMLFAALLLLVFSCTSTDKKPDAVQSKSLSKYEQLMDSLRVVHADTVNMQNCPLTIDTAYIENEEGYGRADFYTVVKIKVTNKSKMAVVAGRIKFKAVDAYNKPVIVDEVLDFNYGTVQFDHVIKPGQSGIAKAKYITRLIKHIENAWPWEVAFENRDVWTANKK